jgi:hypothetical protein
MEMIPGVKWVNEILASIKLRADEAQTILDVLTVASDQCRWKNLIDAINAAEEEGKTSQMNASVFRAIERFRGIQQTKPLPADDLSVDLSDCKAVLAADKQAAQQVQAQQVVVAAQPQPSEAAAAAPGAKRRGRPKKDNGQDPNQTTLPLSTQDTAPDTKPVTNPACANVPLSDLVKHDLYTEMVRNWNATDLEAEFIKVMGAPPDKNMKTGQKAIAIMTGKLVSSDDLEAAIEAAKKQQAAQPQPPAKASAASSPKSLPQQPPQQAQQVQEAKATNQDILQALAEEVQKTDQTLAQVVASVDAEAKSSAPPKSFPADPMPNHGLAHKVWFAGVGEFWECGKCAATELIMCIPSQSQEGKLLCSVRCQSCQHEEIFPLSEQDADATRKAGRVLSSRAPQPSNEPPAPAPAPAPAGPKRKKAAQAVQFSASSAPPSGSSVQVNPPGVPTGSPASSHIINIADPTAAIAAVLNSVPKPEVDVAALARQMEPSIRMWPLERRILEYEKIAKKQVPAQGREQFVDTECVKVIADHFAQTQASF